MKKRLRQLASVLVLPEPVGIGVRISERTRNFYGDADVYDDFRAGLDSGEIFDVREFGKGDRIQRIQWKLSAKADTLLVREDSQPNACPLVFCLERRNVRKRRAKTQDMRDLVVAASVVFSLMDAGCAHYAAWYSAERQESVRLRIDDEESYYLFLTSYMEDCFAEAPMELMQMYDEKFRFDHPLYRLKLTADLRLVLNGAELARLNGTDWKTRLEQKELLL